MSRGDGVAAPARYDGSVPRFMTHSLHDDAPVASSESLADAYAALLRREQQIDALEASFGWRLLSRYGPYKRRYVLPAVRAVRRALGRFRKSSAPEAEPYAAWATFVDRLHALVPVSEESATPRTRVTLALAIDDAGATVDLDRLLASVLAQMHDEWELLVASVGSHIDPNHPRDPRIWIDPTVYESEAAALEAMVARASGAIVAPLPVDVILPPDALRIVVAAFRETDADALYTDEDRLEAGHERRDPRFLPGWSPDLLLSTMYWSRVTYYRREVLSALLPLSRDLDGAHGYDLALRATARSIRVAHVPRVLVHVTGAVAETSVDAAARQRALEGAVARRDPSARVTSLGAGAFRVRRPIAARATVSIVIPTRDGFSMLRRCLAAIARTRHPNIEVILVDNGSRDAATLALLASSGHRVLRDPGPFNFSRLNNLAVREATGRYVLFLNDDTEPADPSWLEALEEHAQRPEVGAVGAKLLYGDGRVQHAGIGLGIGGIAGHPGRFARVLPDLVRDVSAVTAACLMLRREVFEAVGGFDEALPVNSNDVDLCLRLRARGLLVVYTPHAVVRHYESQTRGRRATGDDQWLMLRRWRDVLRADPYYSPNLDRREETGAPDLDKPDGWVCLYPGAPRPEGQVDLSPGSRVEQRCFVTTDFFTGIVVQGSVSGPVPDEALRLVIRGAADDAPVLRVVDRSMAGLRADERWFPFAPIVGSRDAFFRFSLEVTPQHRATIRRHVVASDVMGPCFENGHASFGTLQFRLYARAPYRCART